MDRLHDTGIAVSDAKRLNACFNELVGRLTASPEAELPYRQDVKILPRTGRRFLKGDSGIALDLNRSAEMQELASIRLANLIAQGSLQLWVRSQEGEMTVDHAPLGQISHATIATGNHVSTNSASPLDGMPLWVKEAEWDQALKYRLGVPPTSKPKRAPGRPNAREEAIAIHKERLADGTALKIQNQEAEAIYAVLSARYKGPPKINAQSIAKALREWRKAERINSDEK